jgi:hypothetical protein
LNIYELTLAQVAEKSQSGIVTSLFWRKGEDNPSSRCEKHTPFPLGCKAILPILSQGSGCQNITIALFMGEACLQWSKATSDTTAHCPKISKSKSKYVYFHTRQLK